MHNPGGRETRGNRNGFGCVYPMQYHTAVKEKAECHNDLGDTHKICW